MSDSSDTLNLEDRFMEPPGWRWHKFKNDGRNMRFGSAFPQDSIPDAVVVCLPGLSEFCEKYFEVARDCLNRNLAFWVLDWAGQGKSSRYLGNTHQRHSNGFEHDVDDLNAFVMGYIKHSSVHPDKGRIPLVMLGHSMGANIGLHYLAKYPGIFECAAFTAPLMGIAELNRLVPKPLQGIACALANLFMGKQYVKDGRDWHEDMRDGNFDSFTHDPVRADVHNTWCRADPELQVGSPTYGWLYHAIKSCEALDQKRLSSIQTHCLLAYAGQENIVDNNAIERALKYLPKVDPLYLEGARHEILMEKDKHRDDFFDAFAVLIKESILERPETLKPF